MASKQKGALEEVLSYIPAPLERQIRRAQIGVLARMIGVVLERRRDEEDLARLEAEAPLEIGSW